MIEDLIKQALSVPEIGAHLTTYAGQPAVFYQQAPHDLDKAWAPVQYPRLDYNIDWQFDPERKAAGTFLLNVYCLNNQDATPPEEIGEVIKAQLKDLFLTAEGETYALAWGRTDAFEMAGEQEPVTIGVTMQFDILAFPAQLTAVPDPIEGANRWLKQHKPDAMVIGLDMMPDLYRPTAESPAIYCRLQADGSKMRTSYAMAWMTTTMAIHVFAPDVTARQTICRDLVGSLSLEAEYTMENGSPVLIQQTNINTGSDPLRMGQITFTGEYGILRKEPDYEKINHINMNRTRS